ncbi:hypothetical protein HB779_01300 (plasmid) [Phyllobacterium sp. 628]|uniref:hypothetical protein n=1 Tax=Phyllobacterium sp. 628 TaxID=2718938 RepID=UPI0016623069|nr:hypothetical protein [Phyllobacterium sp. 628]QND50636.1 hypothetical protein HB779_01300 [Phyllobacterium sp. 628]
MTKPKTTGTPPQGEEAIDAKPRRQRDKRFDGYIKGAGFVLATICAILPFVMYYDILEARPKPETTGKTVRDPLNRANQKVVRKNNGVEVSQSKTRDGELDPMTTATTSALTGDRLAGIDAASKQPYPAKPVFLLREVVGGLVMIEDDTGYWFVEKGSPLPDGSTLVAIERGSNSGSWHIKTSDGDVINRTN